MIVAGAEVKSCDPKKFDGHGRDDEILVASREIVQAACSDEVDARGSYELTPSLSCYLQFRIAEVLRQILSEVN